MGNTFQSTKPAPRVPLTAIGGGLGIALVAPVAALFGGTDLGGIAWATVPVAGLAGWRLATVPLGAGRNRRILAAALAFGGLVALGGVLLFILATMVTALLPGSMVARPEGPAGYLIMLVLTLVAITPIVAVPAGVIGLAWAALVRRIGGPAEPA